MSINWIRIETQMGVISYSLLVNGLKGMKSVFTSH